MDIEPPVENQLSREKETSKISTETFHKVGSDVFGFAVTFGLEMARADLVHPQLDPLKQGQPPLVNYDNSPHLLVEALQHGGDTLEGYGISLATYAILTKLATQKIPEKLRLAFSFLTANAVVVAVESGILRGRPDFLDIPAGVVGSSFFLGMHLLGTYLGRRAQAKIDAKQDII